MGGQWWLWGGRAVLCLCILLVCTDSFNISFPTMQTLEVQEMAGLCSSLIPEEFRDYYTLMLTDTGVICITRCDSRHSDPLPCVYGSCFVAQTGPRCECSDQAAYWYQDSACSSRISKMAVAVSVLLVILFLVTAVLLLRSWRKKQQYRDQLRSRSEPYHSDYGDWDGSQGFAIGNSGSTQEDMQERRNRIDPGNVDTSRTMHIQRLTLVL